MKPKDSEVYLSAAAAIASGKFDVEGQSTEGACDVLYHVSLPESFGRADLKNEFRHYFVDTEDYFLMDEACDGPQEAKAVRILALCFMAAIAKSERR